MNKPSVITVAIVEDQSELRESLREVLDASAALRCVAACANGEEAVRDLPELRPQVVFMDINLPGMDGVECVKQLLELMPEVMVVMLTAYDNTDAIFRSLEAGACGYLHKPVTGRDLVAAAKDVVNGASPMSGKIARLVIQAFKKPLPTPPLAAAPSAKDAVEAELTAREKEVLHLLLDGLLYKEIGDAMGVSSHTVNFHIQKIYQKLHCRSRAQVVARFLNP
ncbi:MAG: response regulator transcription factor [Verrucomicrobia bacterium]|nr:response regulator transcription factor [Verrucomicrobiota bacterium]